MLCGTHGSHSFQALPARAGGVSGACAVPPRAASGAAEAGRRQGILDPDTALTSFGHAATGTGRCGTDRA